MLLRGAAIRVEVPPAMVKVGEVEEVLAGEAEDAVVTVVAGAGGLGVVDAAVVLARLVLGEIPHHPRHQPRIPQLRKSLLMLSLKFEDCSTTKLIFMSARS